MTCGQQVSYQLYWLKGQGHKLTEPRSRSALASDKPSLSGYYHVDSSSSDVSHQRTIKPALECLTTRRSYRLLHNTLKKQRAVLTFWKNWCEHIILASIHHLGGLWQFYWIRWTLRPIMHLFSWSLLTHTGSEGSHTRGNCFCTCWVHSYCETMRLDVAAPQHCMTDSLASNDSTLVKTNKVALRWLLQKHEKDCVNSRVTTSWIIDAMCPSNVY